MQKNFAIILKLPLLVILLVLISCRERITEFDPEELPVPEYAPQEKIISPSKWEHWKQRTSQEIIWDSRFDDEPIKIELLKKEVVKHIIVANTFDDGSFRWYIPEDIANSDMYYIRISKLSNPEDFYESKFFSIRNF